MRCASIGSGSRGNGTLIEAGSTRVLVDCGFSVAETERRLGRFGLKPADLSAVLVTHEHTDHASGVGRLARRHRIPVWMTHGTARALERERFPEVHFLDPHRSFDLGALHIEPVAVPHDANEPCQFVFGEDGQRCGVLTDLGHITQHVLERYSGCQALLLECNHDKGLLAAGPYPAGLKRRVGGAFGHLENRQAEAFLRNLDQSAIRYLAAMHLSEKNNDPHRVLTGLEAVWKGHDGRIRIATQDEGLPWYDLSV
ncbi:MAG: MBL fold metallo-hydrolase [Gammaproteobacteria bacterium]